MAVPRRVLDVQDLSVSFFTEQGELSVVRDCTFHVDAGETLALVGESGCGKSVTALAIMGLLDPPGRIIAGHIRLDGEDLVGETEAYLRRIRGRRIGMVFQEPMTSLNPVFTIGQQIGEVLREHLEQDEAAAREESRRLLERVRIPAPAARLDQYPHELSGGMKQRVMMAMALACRPQLLIADEPTTALDVTIQAQILALLRELQEELGMALLLITHNLGVVAHHAHRVAVMYAGEMAEQAPVRQLFREPLHPYTQALLRSLPGAVDPGAALSVIQGTVPAPGDYPGGCRFAGRCPSVMDHCAERFPPRAERNGHAVACWLHAGGTQR